jgi:hypothetical protein
MGRNWHLNGPLESLLRFNMDEKKEPTDGLYLTVAFDLINAEALVFTSESKGIHERARLLILHFTSTLNQ